MATEMERRRAAAEALRQQHELERQAAERTRQVAEELRTSAESGRRVFVDEVRISVATLTTLLHRMEAVEALRRDAKRKKKS